jgi:hypothetical protein
MIVIPPNLILLFEVFRSAAKNNKIRQGFLMIWYATIWSISCQKKKKKKKLFVHF